MTTSLPLIGAHISTSGGVDQAPLRGRDVGCATMQIFTKSNMQWAARPLTASEIAGFERNCRETGIAPVVAHNSYLVNLCAREPELAKKSLDSMAVELGRCHALNLLGLIMHPGSHPDEEEGIARIAAALNDLLERSKGSKVKLLLENTAGQGSYLGRSFEQLARIIAGVKRQERLGVCFDTCHAFAAGYDIRTPQGYAATMGQFDRQLGLDRLCCFHLNDTKKELASHVDRHEHIGFGQLGTVPFRLIMKDPRFASVPKIIETPKGTKDGEDWDAVTLRLLRELANS
jgi:deoxyribonuclease-4